MDSSLPANATITNSHGLKTELISTLQQNRKNQQLWQRDRTHGEVRKFSDPVLRLGGRAKPLEESISSGTLSACSRAAVMGVRLHNPLHCWTTKVQLVRQSAPTLANISWQLVKVRRRQRLCKHLKNVRISRKSFHSVLVKSQERRCVGGGHRVINRMGPVRSLLRAGSSLLWTPALRPYLGPMR